MAYLGYDEMGAKCPPESIGKTIRLTFAYEHRVPSNHQSQNGINYAILIQFSARLRCSSTFADVETGMLDQLSLHTTTARRWAWRCGMSSSLNKDRTRLADLFALRVARVARDDVCTMPRACVCVRASPSLLVCETQLLPQAAPLQGERLHAGPISPVQEAPDPRFSLA